MLARRATLDDLSRLGKSYDVPTRRAAALAAGFHLTAPPSDYTPPDSLPLSYNAGNAAFTLTFADADKPVDLRALSRVGSFTTAEWWKNVPRTDDDRQLVYLLVNSLADSSGDVVEQAAYFLSLLNDPQTESQIAEARRRVIAGEVAKLPPRTIERSWVLASRGASFYLEKVAPPDRGAVDLAGSYSTGAKEITWQQMEAVQGRFFDTALGNEPMARLYLCFQLQSTARQPAVVEVADGNASLVWHNGRAVVVDTHGAAIELQPGANDLLVRVDAPAKSGVGLQLRAPANVVTTLREKVDFSLLAERLKQAASGSDQVPAELLTADWTNAVNQGDIQRGRKLFGSLGCSKCHGITLEQPGGGAPNLADVRRRFTTAYVVESILLPSKQVADPFRGTTLILADGRTLTGLVVTDTDQQLELLLPDAKRVTIDKAEIEERAASAISPMPSGLVKTEQELRDLLAYLFSDRPTPP